MVTGSLAARELARVDALTLAQASRAVTIGQPGNEYASSPDGSTLAWVSWNGDFASLNLLDLHAMRTRIVPLARVGAATTLTWLGGGRVLVLAEQPEGLRAFVVDPRAPRVVSARRLRAHFAEFANVASTKTGAVVLVRSLNGPPVQAARLAVIGPSGAPRIVAVAGVKIGAVRRKGGQRSYWEIHRPAVVADPAGEQAYVVGAANEPVAAVDLRTGRVTYHRLRGLQAQTTPVRVTDRHAIWMRPGVFAVVGFDEYADATVRLGLKLVDTRTWRAKTVDPGADFAALADTLVVSQRNDLAGAVPEPGFTIAGYTLTGATRFTLRLPDLTAPAEIASNGRYLYLVLHDAANTVVIVDEATGAVAARLKAPASLGLLLSPRRS